MASSWFTSETGNCDIRIIESNRHGTVIDYIAGSQIGSVTGDEAKSLALKISQGEKLSGRYFEGHRFTPCEPMWD